MSRKILFAGILAGSVVLMSCSAVWASDRTASTVGAADASPSLLFAACLVCLVPAGLTMIAAGSSDQKKAPAVAAAGLIGAAFGVVVYAVIGFGFQFGGAALLSGYQGSQELVSEWSPLDRVWGPGWGIIGLDGFLLIKEPLDAQDQSLLLYYGALAATAACIPALALARRVKTSTLVCVMALFAAVIYPVYANWVWGGGWLSQLGRNVGLGHGFVDLAGAGAIHAVGGFAALSGILVSRERLERRRRASKPPPAHFPLLAILGTFLLFPGWFGLAAGNPLLSDNVSIAQMVLNVLLAACGAILVSGGYIWFATGGTDVLMVARGAVAGLVAISACSAFVSPSAALLIGGIAGLLLPVSIYLLDVRLGLRDPTAAISMNGVAGLWGLLALGIFANGESGQGWNGVGIREYLDVAGQGVSGLLVQPGFQPDWPQQFYAQIVGSVSLLVLAFGILWLALRGLDGVAGRLSQLRNNVRTAAHESDSEE